MAQSDKARLVASFDQLVSSSLIMSEGDGFRLTELGRFTGESGVHVDSIVCLAHVLRGVGPRLNSVGLITAAQLTNDLDGVYLLVNAKAKNTEVPRWPRVLEQQGVPRTLIRALGITAADTRRSTARAKRAAAAAMWVSRIPMETIERELNQHMYQQVGLAGALFGRSPTALVICSRQSVPCFRSCTPTGRAIHSSHERCCDSSWASRLIS